MPILLPILLWRRSLSVLTGWRSSVLSLRWLPVARLPSVLLLWLLLSVAAGLRSGRHGSAAHRHLLVLGVVAGVDGAEDQFDHPEVWGEIDWRLGLSHLCRLVLVIWRLR